MVYSTPTAHLPPPPDLEAHVDTARRHIEALLKKAPTPLIAYSGGKDGIVAAHLAATEFGVLDALCETSFYFARQTANVKRIATKIGLRCVYTETVDVAWLRAHPEVVFADDVAIRSWSFAQRHQRAVKRMARQQKHGGILYGRRLEENTVPAALYETRDGWQSHPLREWRVEHIWGYFRTRSLPVPWIYSTEFGRLAGNAPFYTLRARDVGGMKQAWALVAQLDPRYTPALLKEPKASKSSKKAAP